jgi:cytochrome P450
MGVATKVRTAIGRRVLAKTGSGALDLARLPAIPKRFRLAFLRHGLDPVPELAERRRDDPVIRLGRLLGMNIWLVAGHAEARQVLSDNRDTYSNNVRPFIGNLNDSDAHRLGGLGFTDPPDHTRLRRILTPEFTRRRLQQLEPKIISTIDDQLNELQRSGPVVDLVRDFAFPIPFTVICDLLGLPVDDRDAFLELGPARFDVTTGGVGALDAGVESRAFLLEAVRRQRADPGEGLLGQIIRDQPDVDDVELAGLADGVFTGGYETSVSMLSLGSLVLLRNPDAMRMLRTEPDRVDGIVEEMLRYLTVVQIAFPRFARHDHLLGGRRIRTGDPVLVSLIGADRDPLVYGENADQFDPHRQLPASHFAFGHGLHRCVGAELARTELRAAFVALARRFDKIELAVAESELEFQELSIVYGLKALPVRLEQAHPRS